MPERKFFFTEGELSKLAAKYADKDGLTMPEILAIFHKGGIRLSESTFRKYVQLGLVERSYRIGGKGKNRGSWGLYPVLVIRQVSDIKRLISGPTTLAQLVESVWPIRRKILAARANVETAKEILLRQCGNRAKISAKAAVALAAIDDLVKTLDHLVETR